MILVDYLGHLVSTESEEELHKFAQEKLDVEPKWYRKDGYARFKIPHYDLFGQTLLKQALRQGAKQVTIEELIERAWRRQK